MNQNQSRTLLEASREDRGEAQASLQQLELGWEPWAPGAWISADGGEGHPDRGTDSRSQSAVHRIRKTREHIHLCESVEGLLGREGQLEIGI